jgi:GSH-dependent disulfide-bond oxidoreductase
MDLYTAGTGNGQRAAIALNECGVNCNIHVLNLGRGDQKAADYLKLNSTGRIPTLIDPDGPGGKPLTVTQSWAILLYLCEKAGKFHAGRSGRAGADVSVDGRRRCRLRVR